MSYNAADPKQVKEREDATRNRRQTEIADIKAIMSMPQGIRFVRRLMATGSIFRTTFTGNSEGMYREGMRALALMVLDDVCLACPEKIVELMIKPKEEGNG
jgi:hypothetical protein